MRVFIRRLIKSLIGLFVLLLLLSLLFNYKFQQEIERRKHDAMLYPGHNSMIMDLLGSGQTIRLYSSGGLPSYGLKYGKIIEDEAKTLIIDEFCASACPEYLLPSAHRIIFENQPIIGVHGDMFYYEKLYNTKVNKLKNPCNMELVLGVIEGKKELYNRAHLSTNFWEEKVKRLKPNPIITYSKKEGCLLIDYNFKNRFWYPTSKQLRELWGLKFEGSVCADHPKCFSKIRKWQLPGDRIVIGDDLYVSWGLFLHKLGRYDDKHSAVYDANKELGNNVQ